MKDIGPMIVGMGVVGIFVWLIWPSKSAVAEPTDSSGTVIDDRDPEQVALLIGFSVGSIPDAAAAQFVLRRFEETHGRKATTRDIGHLIGLMSSLE